MVPNYADDLVSRNCMESKPLEGLRVGVIQETLGEGVDSGVVQAIQSAALHLDQLGARVSEVSCSLHCFNCQTISPNFFSSWFCYANSLVVKCNLLRGCVFF